MIIGAASSSTTSTILVCLVWSRYSLLRGLRSSLCFVFRVETHTIQLLQLQQIPFLFQINTIQATHFSIVCRTENSLNLCFSFWYVFFYLLLLLSSAVAVPFISALFGLVVITIITIVCVYPCATSILVLRFES